MACEMSPANGELTRDMRRRPRRYLSAAINSETERFDCDRPSTLKLAGLAAASAMSASVSPLGCAFAMIFDSSTYGERVKNTSEAICGNELICRDELQPAVAAHPRHANRATVVESPDLLAVAAPAVRAHTVVTVTVAAIAVPVAFPFTNIHTVSFFFQFSAFRFHLWNVRQQVHNP